MLGSLRSNKVWEWAAFGKHPAARDFIRLGPDLPIFNAFCTWVEQGFVQMRQGNDQGFNSWRFWARGTKKSHLVCGLVRDSRDSVGRPYPCLVIGTGLLADWEDHWDELPVVLEETWRNMEYLFVREANTIDELRDDLNRLRPPKIKAQENDAPHNMLSDPIGNTPYTRKEGVWHHAIDGDDLCADASRWLNGLSTVPNAVFLGGVPERSALIAYSRSLQPADFVCLWSAGL